MTRVTTQDEGIINFQPGFDNAAQSAIVTGCTPWTLYEYDYYLGNSICLPAGQRTTHAGSCEPAFYNSNSSLGLLAGEVSSMRKGCWTQQSHSIHCYDYTGQGGDQFRTNDVVAELWKQSFDNKIESCCFDGFWILYGGDSFNNATSIQESWWGFGSSYCTDVPTQFRNGASSLRYVGLSQDWVGDSLNLYTRENYGGMTRVTTQDEGIINFQPGFDNAAQSAIVTGCTPWTLYEYDYYLGNSICLPAGSGQMTTHMGSCEPAFYSSNSSFGLLAGQVSSMRKGCWTQVMATPNKMVKTSENGLSGWSGLM